MNIRFDKIHTKEKQALLSLMMNEVANKLVKIPNNNTKQNCPICGSSEYNHYVEAFQFNMDICSKCNHLYCNPMPNKEQLNLFYNSEMKDFENKFFLESFNERLPIFRKRLEIISKYKNKGKVLDIGSAIGLFAEVLLVNKNYNLECCDPSIAACDLLSRKYSKIKVHKCMLEDLSLDYNFDIITMWDTLENLISPSQIIDKVYNLLDKDGLFIFSTPNTKSFEWDIAKDKHVQLLPPGHINLYNIKSIEILLKNNNFSIIETFTLNPSLDIDYVLKNENSFKEDIGAYLVEKLKDIKFRESFESLLKENKQAGNIMVITKKNG